MRNPAPGTTNVCSYHPRLSGSVSVILVALAQRLRSPSSRALVMTVTDDDVGQAELPDR
jgi:hypothetical protein